MSSSQVVQRVSAAEREWRDVVSGETQWVKSISVVIDGLIRKQASTERLEIARWFVSSDDRAVFVSGAGVAPLTGHYS